MQSLFDFLHKATGEQLSFTIGLVLAAGLLHKATGEQLSFTIGLVLAAGLLLQLVIEIARGLLRVYSDRRQQRLALEKLRVQIKETTLRCQEVQFVLLHLLTTLRCQEVEQNKLLWNGHRKF